MKRVLLAALLFSGCQCRLDSRPAVEASKTSQETASYEVHFSPNGGCESAVVRHVDAAKHSVLVQAYSFTNRAITDALIRAHERRVKVLVILDRSDETSKGSTLEDLRAAHIEVAIDRKHAISHNKVMLFDDQVTLTGSFNFTAAAEHSNAENCLFVTDNALAGSYTDNWYAHRAHSGE